MFKRSVCSLFVAVESTHRIIVHCVLQLQITLQDSRGPLLCGARTGRLYRVCLYLGFVIVNTNPTRRESYKSHKFNYIYSWGINKIIFLLAWHGWHGRKQKGISFLYIMFFSAIFCIFMYFNVF